MAGKAVIMHKQETKVQVIRFMGEIRYYVQIKCTSEKREEKSTELPIGWRLFIAFRADWHSATLLISCYLFKTLTTVVDSDTTFTRYTPCARGMDTSDTFFNVSTGRPVRS